MSCNIYDAYRGKLIKMAPLYKDSIPDGKTVVPTDDIQILLKCAGVKNKDYTTINELLADSDSLATVIESENAIDYLVRSTTLASDVTANQTAMTDIGQNNYAANTLLADETWRTAICNSTYFESVLNVKVPKMTDNTHPSGQCMGSSLYSGSNYYIAFDGGYSNGVYMASGLPIASYRLTYKFDSPVKIYKAVVSTWGHQNYWYEYAIFGSNDNSSFDRLSEINDRPVRTSVDELTTTNIFITDDDYEYISIQITNSNGNTCYTPNYGGFVVREAQFYGRVDI